VCTEGVQGCHSDQGHVHAVGSPTIDGERDHAHLGHVHFDGCGNQDGRPPGTMDFDMDGCMNGSSGHDGKGLQTREVIWMSTWMEAVRMILWGVVGT
jgi:hypothetical protein